MKIAAGILLCLIGVLSQAKGAAINYTITFTATSGDAPTSGSFKYDPAITTVGGSPFSDFFVVWRGITIDLTDDANFDVRGNCGSSGGISDANFNFETVLSNGITTCGTDRTWRGFQPRTNYTFIFNVFQPNPLLQRQIEYQGSSLLTDQLTPDEGTFTITSQGPDPVPEPSTVIMTISGAVLFLTTRVRRSRTKNEETSGK